MGKAVAKGGSMTRGCEGRKFKSSPATKGMNFVGHRVLCTRAKQRWLLPRRTYGCRDAFAAISIFRLHGDGRKIGERVPSAGRPTHPLLLPCKSLANLPKRTRAVGIQLGETSRLPILCETHMGRASRALYPSPSNNVNVRASNLHRGGGGFDSCLAHHIYQGFPLGVRDAS